MTAPDSESNARYAEICRLVAEDGKRRHMRWDETLFIELAAESGHALWVATASDAGGADVAAAYVRLLGESIGLGYLDRSKLGSSDLFARTLVHAVPAGLPRCSPPLRMDLLARIWNLCEGLRSEPEWVFACVSGLIQTIELDRLHEQLIEAMVLLEAGERSEFRAPFTVSVVDLRALDEAFLPGKLHFSSPAALCVHDRRTEGRLAAVVLMPGAGARVLRLKACLGASAVEEPLPPVATRPSALEFGGNVVPLPTLSQVLATATSPAGFVVADALDSQRLWVITASS